jgi:hypothetical protein
VALNKTSSLKKRNFGGGVLHAERRIMIEEESTAEQTNFFRNTASIEPRGNILFSDTTELKGVNSKDSLKLVKPNYCIDA